jgi:hypothetical protein
MARRKFTKKRLELLLALEQIIGNECYNPNIQNWGPGGSYEGEGRRIRYPLTVEDENGIKRKRRVSITDLEPNQLMQGYYAFGSNQLHIMKALGAVIDYLVVPRRDPADRS